MSDKKETPRCAYCGGKGFTFEKCDSDCTSPHPKICQHCKPKEPTNA